MESLGIVRFIAEGKSMTAHATEVENANLFIFKENVAKNCLLLTIHKFFIKL